MIFDQQYLANDSPTRWFGDLRHLRRSLREDETYRRSGAWRRFDFGATAVTLHDSVDLGKPESGSSSALCREEWLERALSHFGRHADAGVADLEMHSVYSNACAHAEGAATIHRVERVLHEIEQRFA